MADGTNEAPKAKKKRGYSLVTLIVSNVASFLTGGLGTLGVLAGTNHIRTPEERDAAAKLEAQNKATK